MKTKEIKDPTFSIYKDGGNVENKAKATGKKELQELSAKKDIFDIRFDVLEDIRQQLQEDYEKERKKGQNFFQWLESKPDDYFKRLELANGGKVIDFSKYKKSKNPKIKKLDLASAFDHAKTISSLTDDERDLVVRMLRMSLGKED